MIMRDSEVFVLCTPIFALANSAESKVHARPVHGSRRDLCNSDGAAGGWATAMKISANLPRFLLRAGVSSR